MIWTKRNRTLIAGAEKLIAEEIQSARGSEWFPQKTIAGVKKRRRLPAIKNNQEL